MRRSHTVAGVARWVAFVGTGAVFVAMALFLAGCGGKDAATEQPPVTVEVTVPVVQTQVVVETREVEKTVVVTATPVPTPAYVSRITVPAGTLAYPLSSEPVSLDPQEASDEISALVVQQLYEGLFNLRQDGSTVPAAATGYDVSSDGKVYTVTLRSGMTWSDGRPVTAQNYVDGVCRLLAPATGSDYYYMLTEVAPISGAKEFASGDVVDCTKVGVKAVDDHTLQIALDRPVSFFPKLLAFQTFLPVRADLIKAGETVTQSLTTGAGSGASTMALHSVVNGPYVLAEWVPGDRIVLNKNSTYWNADQVLIDRIEFKIVPKLEDQLAQYEKGDLQVADFPAEETPLIQADPGFANELKVLGRPGTSYIGLNTQVTPTLDVNVRRAIASAIDRKALIDDVLKQPWHVPAQVLVPPDIPGYQGEDPTVGVPYDPDAARKYLADAGYGPDNPIPPVEIWFNREGNNEAIFEAIGNMLEQIGIPVRLNESSWNVYRNALDACNKPNRPGAARTPAQCTYNAYRMGWVMDYADPSSMLDTVFSPKSTLQYTGWQSPEYEKLLADALAEQDETKREELYKQAEKLLLNDLVAAVPLQHYDRTLLIKDGVVADYPPIGAPNLQYWKLP
jgi:oligopeptide transport system substrate-binding protein